jgi:D-lactate dehydrogenase
MRIAVFSAKSYDKESFEAMNRAYGYELTYFEMHLNASTVGLAQGFDVVCAFVNDTLNQSILKTLSHQGIKLIAMRSAGYNNVDLKAAQALDIQVVRVPAYSPHAVAEHVLR